MSNFSDFSLEVTEPEKVCYLGDNVSVCSACFRDSGLTTFMTLLYGERIDSPIFCSDCGRFIRGLQLSREGRERLKQKFIDGYRRDWELHQYMAEWPFLDWKIVPGFLGPYIPYEIQYKIPYEIP